MAFSKEYNFAWEIENYYLHYLTGEDIKSPVFTPKYFGGSKWYLVLKSCRETNEFLICLCRNDDDLYDGVISVSFQFDIKSDDGTTVMSRGRKYFVNEFESGGCFYCYNMYGSVDMIHEANLNRDREIIIINCRMYKTDRNLPRCEAVTKVGIDTFSFNWKIKMSDGVQSRTFSKASQYEITVSVPHDYADIKIKKFKGNSALPVALCISLLNKEEEVDVSLKAGFCFRSTDGDELWKFPPFISKEELENVYMDDGAFSLFCEFSEPNGNNQSNVVKHDSHFSNKLKNIITLHNDFDELLKLTDERHSDIKLITEDAVLFAHKSVLIARSPVFRAMFDHGMSEEQTGIIEVSDVDTETLKTFLIFLYSGTVIIPDSGCAMNLLIIAHKYEVPTLIKTASDFLKSTLTPKIACKALYLADMMDLEDLKKVALNYVSKHAEEISKTSDWAEYIEKNVRLSADISAHLLANIEIERKKWLERRRVLKICSKKKGYSRK